METLLHLLVLSLLPLMAFVIVRGLGDIRRVLLSVVEPQPERCAASIKKLHADDAKRQRLAFMFAD